MSGMSVITDNTNIFKRMASFVDHTLIYMKKFLLATSAELHQMDGWANERTVKHMNETYFKVLPT